MRVAKKQTMGVAMVLFACLFGIQLSRTAVASPCSGVSCSNTAIERLYITGTNPGNARVYVRPTDGGQTDLDCTPVEDVYLTLKPSHPLFDEIFSSLRDAALLDKRVSLRIREQSPDCEIRYIVIENP